MRRAAQRRQPRRTDPALADRRTPGGGFFSLQELIDGGGIRLNDLDARRPGVRKVEQAVAPTHALPNRCARPRSGRGLCPRHPVPDGSSFFFGLIGTAAISIGSVTSSLERPAGRTSPRITRFVRYSPNAASSFRLHQFCKGLHDVSDILPLNAIQVEEGSIKLAPKPKAPLFAPRERRPREPTIAGGMDLSSHEVYTSSSTSGRIHWGDSPTLRPGQAPSTRREEAREADAGSRRSNEPPLDFYAPTKSNAKDVRLANKQATAVAPASPGSIKGHVWPTPTRGSTPAITVRSFVVLVMSLHPINHCRFHRSRQARIHLANRNPVARENNMRGVGMLFGSGLRSFPRFAWASLWPS